MIDIVCVLDKSGSMESIRTDTIGSFNTFLNDQKGNKHADRVRMSLIMFDHEYRPQYTQKLLHYVDELTLETYVPGGSTALLEAVCRTITDLTQDDTNEDTVFVVITDGHENASSEDYTTDATKELVQNMEKEGWEFHFLGAGLSDFDEAGGMGFAATYSFDHSSKGTRNLYAATASLTSDYIESRIETENADEPPETS